MARTKIDYGIDLGTTNSAIARMENGEPIIKKSEGFQKDTTSSCVHYNKKKHYGWQYKDFHHLKLDPIVQCKGQYM